MPIHISSSQIKSFRRCGRLHWLQKVAQIPSDKPKLGAERGKALHTLVETYLGSSVGGTEIDFLGFLESQGLYDHELRHAIRSFCINTQMQDLRKKFHSTTTTKLLIEQEFKLGGLFMGYMDLVCVEKLETGELSVSIRDHKFLADKRYIPTMEELENDPQTIMYGAAVLYFFKLDHIDMVYDYYGTRSKWYEPRKIHLTAEELSGKWEALKQETFGILDNYLIEDAVATDANFLSCQMYGGCDYKNICFEQ